MHALIGVSGSVRGHGVRVGRGGGGVTTDAEAGFDPAAVLEAIDAATGQLLETAARFTDAEVHEPSLLPNWSRGHVLTHLARNAR